MSSQPIFAFRRPHRAGELASILIVASGSVIMVKYNHNDYK